MLHFTLRMLVCALCLYGGVSTRGITRGTTRGNNTLYEVDIPASALQAGSNRIEIGLASGSPDNGYLSPAVVFDSVQLVAL